MNNLDKLIKILIFISINLQILYSFNNPYSVNSPVLPQWCANSLKSIGIKIYRIPVNWELCEPEDVPQSNPWTDPGYKWNSITEGLNSARTTDSKVILSVFNSPEWARIDYNKIYSYPPLKFADFLKPLLEYCYSVSTGIVYAVEVGDEDHIYGKKDAPDLSQRVDREPSQYYVNILKIAYQTVKEFDSNILVLPFCIMLPAGHFLDELYLLNLGNYFDKVNVHYDMNYLENGPVDKNTTFHYPTALRYIEFISRDNFHENKIIWNTSFSYKNSDENLKSTYYCEVLETSRKSGFCELCTVNPALSENYTSTSACNFSALIYCDKKDNPSIIVNTTSYFMYQTYISSYPDWNPAFNREPLDLITPAENDINMTNGNFEKGDTTGWTGLTIDVYIKHSGKYSGTHGGSGTVVSDYYNVEPGKLYEVYGWIKINPLGLPETYYLKMKVLEKYNDTFIREWVPPYYDSIISTLKYYPTATWRRIRFMYLAPGDINKIALNFDAYDVGGGGRFWLDDFNIYKLDFSTREISVPVISVNVSSLEFGEVQKGESKTLSFQITNSGTGVLEGNISSDREWIKIDITSFKDNNITVNVTVDNSILNEKTGQYSGNIMIVSNGGDINIPVYLTATCVIVYPNPFNPQKEILKFSGSGISPKTKIKIWTVNGEMIKNLVENFWDGKDEKGKNVNPGIYLFTYEGPEEKGTGKIILIK